jgi:cytochrome c553
MKMHNLRAAACALLTGNTRTTRWTHLHRRSWLPVASGMLAVLCASVAVAVARNQKARSQQPQELPPYWAYPINPPAKASHARSRPVDNAPLHVPGSRAAFTRRQISDGFSPPDWHPDAHPPMPEIVAHGRRPQVAACGYCHLPNGQGRPENASLAGLPVDYFIRQVADFKSGRRKCSKPGFLPAEAMTTHEIKATPQEIQTAATYFSNLKLKPWIRVIETATVPKTHVAGWMLVPTAGGGSEPIGERIIETPVNLELTEMRDDASGFIAYVPVGSVEKGRGLVTTGAAGTTIQCAICHGPDLKGLGNVPSIAGRSPSYIVRQIYDIQSGARNGVDTQLMKPVVARLTLDDTISIAAYLASLHP